MTFDVQLLLNAFIAMQVWEVMATLFGIAYVILAAKESLWAWFFAFFGTLIYTILFWEGQLLSSAVLNFYYMVMALYGYSLWRKHENSSYDVSIRSWSLSLLFIVIIVGIIFVLVVGYFMELKTQTQLPYLDAFVMVFSGIGTWMLAQKILENWLIWMVVDSAAIALYWQTGYYATIVLFILYVILAFYGYTSWRKAKNAY